VQHEEEDRHREVELLLERDVDQPQNMITSGRASGRKFVP